MSALKAVFVTSLLIFSTTAIPSAFAGPGGTGGGNYVGNELLDDYDLAGSKVISPAKLREISAPVIDSLAAKVPEFAAELEKGFTDVKWYLEPKPLSQSAICLDQTVLSVERKVRACQSKASVRIQERFFKSHPEKMKDLIVHELLEHWKLNSDGIIDEQVFAVSRVVRNPSSTPEEITAALKENGFGSFLTAAQKQSERKELYSMSCNYFSSPPPYQGELSPNLEALVTHDIREGLPEERELALPIFNDVGDFIKFQMVITLPKSEQDRDAAMNGVEKLRGRYCNGLDMSDARDPRSFDGPGMKTDSNPVVESNDSNGLSKSGIAK